MNKPIRSVAIFCMLLFVALMLNATYVQYWKSSSYAENPLNRRIIDAAYSRERGAIVAGRKPIAQSLPSDDEYKYQRTYPQPLKYAHVTGYFSRDTLTGIERTQNQVLSGDDARLFLPRLVDLVNNAQPQGGQVQLTIDPAAQSAAYDAVVAGLGPDAEASVVAIEPSTGKVLAMVSLPSYDPNRLASHDYSAANAAFKELSANPEQPLLNRAIQTRLPPGSTFKLVTAAAAIESGRYDGADSLVPGGPSYKLPNSDSVVDNGGRSCGTDRIPMTQALEQSCNTTFLALADELGNDKLAEQAEKFGFNSHYLDDLAPQAESLYPRTDERAFNALTGIGQWDVQATPLQMAMVVAGIANGGVVKKPYLVDEVLSQELETIDKTSDEDLSRAVSGSTADELTDMMVNTVTRGTASPAAISGVDVAGKTGTAENCDSCSNFAWFVGFAPADDPQVAVAVMIQKTNVTTEIAGGQLGGPIARAVMQAVIGQ